MLRRALHAHQRGDIKTAERLYNGLLQREPDSFEALHGLGQIHFQRGRPDTAVVLFQSALRNDPDRADGFASLGLAFHSLRRLKEALASYDAGLRIEPDHRELLNRRGVALLDLQHPAEALDCFERVLAVDPDHLDALGNSGNALIKLNRPHDALAAYDRALVFAPGNAQLLTNRATALRRLDRPHEAQMSASRALQAKPGSMHARFVESVAQLTLGDFAAGWRGYEARWGVGALARERRDFAGPLWLGEMLLGGKTVLLHFEQGFGDTIQFVRYAPHLIARGAGAVIVEVQPELKRLLSAMPGVTVVARGEPLPRYDLHCPLMSLPLACGTRLETVPEGVPYLNVPADLVDAWSGCLPDRRPRIGLVWSGERSHDNDLNRSVRLELLLPLLDLAGVTFVSLQHEVREEDGALLDRHPNIARLPRTFADFADTAAVIAALDMVIAVDSAVAHLAGAMGKPLCLLLPFAADFRWLRERKDSPWYPTARLYRQPAFADWASVIANLRAELIRQPFGGVECAACPQKLSA